MKKSIFCILLVIAFMTSCIQDQNKQLPTEAELNFSEALMTNFTESAFLKEEENFVSKFNKEAKRPSEVYEALGITLYQQKNISAAILVFEKSAEVYSNNEDIVSSLAVLHEKNKNKAAAIKNLTLAIAIANTNKSNGEAFYKSELKRLTRRAAKPGVDIMFDEDVYEFSQDDKQLITSIILQSEKKVRTLLQTLPKDIRLIISIIDREINEVGGVTGRAETHTPGEVMVEISNVFPGGVGVAAKTSLAATIFHELHHIYRGWTMKGNKFGPGIPNAMVNEGLAVAFAEIHTGEIFEGNSFPQEADSWVKEILLLPKNANYSDWVSGEHPDGRTSIGYRAGNYLIRKTIAVSGKNVLELSKLSPDEILSLANYK